MHAVDIFETSKLKVMENVCDQPCNTDLDCFSMAIFVCPLCKEKTNPIDGFTTKACGFLF